MADSKSEDWLPPGWTVKERVRDNGKKDKYYHAPSNGPTFNSRAEVSRYLFNTKQTDYFKAKKKNQATLKQSGEVVVVEKGEAEGLPPGWIKEIRVRKRGDSIRKDPFYFDPVSKNVFRSLKAVNRHLKTEELGTLTQNSEGSIHKDSEDDCTFQLGVSRTRRLINFDRSSDMNKTVQEQQLGVSRTRRLINFDRSSDMNKTVQEVRVHNSSSQPSPLSDHAAELREGGTELRNSDLQESKDLGQKGEKGDSSKSKFFSVPAVDEVLPIKESHESGKRQPDERKSRKKIVPDLPRRASKRLAGLEVDPIPELKPRTRARRVAVKHLGDGAADTSEGSSPGNSAQCNQPETDSKSSKFSQLSNRSKNFCDNLVTSEKQVGKLETIVNYDEKQMFPVLPLENQISPYDKADMVPGAPLDLPPGEFLMDPCIAFAIKTLTGLPLDNSESSEVLPRSTSSEHSSANLAVEIFGKVETESKINGEQDRCAAVSLEEHATNIENDANNDEKLGSPTDFSFCRAWQDPCIEFAIKTLTDAIPLDYDPNIQQNFQQQPSWSKTQGSDEMSFTSVQTDFSCQQSCDVEKPGFQQELQVPHSGTVSLRNSDRSELNRRGKERQ
ncbi:uncharacterized protein LOC21398851 isoform X2 [Morus notabilis]|uniref:uncharacterized protein LOC21398851 isoform X2 n=1 Tax=Morus notabilis TaxID=981085 RepID=UPI000CECE8A8|nr:uncharacterized protein LOC21398851 isoform X2 [Morus notabilis]